MASYADALDQLRAAGLLVDQIVIGKLQRCRVEGTREKRGWYFLHEIHLSSGDVSIAGSFGIWRGGSKNAQKIAHGRDEMSAEQRQALKKRIAEDLRRVNAARAVEARRAAQRAEAVWRKCSEDGDSEYLKRKHVGAHGVRFSPSGALVIPLLDAAGVVHGLQIIRGRERRRDELDKEFWPTGVAKRGHFHLIGMPIGIVLVAEGYATGASLHEATGLPVAIAFDANNLAPVAAALRKRYPNVRILVCADDDRFGKCKACRERIVLGAEQLSLCTACGKEHGVQNTGVNFASSAALEVGGAFVTPTFADDEGRKNAYLETGAKITDFNDLHVREGLHVVRAQIEGRLGELGWGRSLASASSARDTSTTEGQGGALRVIESLETLLTRYALIYGLGGSVFDRQEHVVVTLQDMAHACLHKALHRAWMEHPKRVIVRPTEVDFDPACADPSITCNLWAGWPTAPKAGKCEKLLELLRHMCSEELFSEELYRWVLRWLAYPIQHPGAKMKTTLVLHGPQGTGKNLFFEAVMAIYGPYGRVIDQASIEDKFNDWASRKLFLIADEVVARSDLFHVKNKLKAFITGEWIRINPKNLAARDERNHVNLVFLSNEPMPVALDEDDRRHAVIWTPGNLPQSFYDEVLRELDEGGAAALHDYLLHYDLGDFTPGTRPPATDAKDELINLGRDSTTRFYLDLRGGELPYKLAPALTTDVYRAYKAYCSDCGLRAAPMPKLLNALHRRHGVPVVRKRYYEGAVEKGPHAILMLGDERDPPPGIYEKNWLGSCIEAFRSALKDARGAQLP